MRRAPLFVLAVLGLLALAAAAQSQTFSPALFSDMQWRPIGPLRGGRGRAVAGVPSQPNVFYIGNDDGGVWKSTDYGNSWQPIFDKEPTSSIGALAVSVSDPKVMYVGTGESNIRPDQATGMGIDFFFSSRRRHTRSFGDWSSDVCSSDLTKRSDSPVGAQSSRMTSNDFSR